MPNEVIFIWRRTAIAALTIVAGASCAPVLKFIARATMRVLTVEDDAVTANEIVGELTARGFEVDWTDNGREGMMRAMSASYDAITLDRMLPGADGLAIVTAMRTVGIDTPVLMLSALGDVDERIRGLRAGGDDYLTKPFEHQALLARVRSMLRIKQLHDEIAELNRSLEARVAEQVGEIERIGRLKRFLAPEVAAMIVGAGEDALATRRRDIAVLFCDLRGFTAFAETAEPEEVMALLREYHGAVGPLIHAHQGTLERFSGDGIMVLFNDPVPCPDPARRAVALASAMRAAVNELKEAWTRRGHRVGFGIGIAQGYATIGPIGFEERREYTAIGTVTNLAARLCAEAQDGQILVSQRVATAVEGAAALTPIGEQKLRGLTRPVMVYDIPAGATAPLSLSAAPDSGVGLPE
jgi:class 3 adenylate cyclase